MADWARTYIDQIDTIIKDDFTTELAAIDATLETIPNRKIFKSFQPFTMERPMIYQYIVGESPFEKFLAHQGEIAWNHYTGVRTIDINPTESDGNKLYAYVEALLKAIYKGNGAPGKLDSTVCYSEPIAWLDNQEPGTLAGGQNFIAKEGGILWSVQTKISLIE